MSVQQLLNGIGQGMKSAATYSARAAANANGVSRAAQKAQGDFNQGSANNANAIGADRIAEQYGFNSGQATMANDYTTQMWERAAGWNEDMFNRSMEFNAQQAQLNREWQERMMSTSYQRAVKDMEKAGLNPILAVTGGGISTGSGGGSAASISSPSMSGASGAMASGGLMNGIAASEGNYTGQMEYMGGVLGILAAMFSGLSTAQTNLATLLRMDNQSREEDKGYAVQDFLEDMFYGNPIGDAEFLPKSQTPYGQRGKNNATAGKENGGTKEYGNQKFKERWYSHN